LREPLQDVVDQIATIVRCARTTAGGRVVLLPDCDEEDEDACCEPISTCRHVWMNWLIRPMPAR